MSSLLDTAIKRSQLVGDWRTWVLRIAAAAREVVCDAKVYVVGSVIGGQRRWERRGRARGLRARAGEARGEG